MFPIGFIAWVGGIAAGAQVAGGCVRSAGKLVRGHPVDALIHLADGLVGPVRVACRQVSWLGLDVYEAVFGPCEADEPDEQVSPWPLEARSRPEESELADESRNGIAAVATDR
jgi:hypothetical protein